MNKLLLFSTALMMSLVFGSGFGIAGQSIFAQNYGYDDDYSDGMSQPDYRSDYSYSKYPKNDKKYESQKGKFEGFYVASPEFCMEDDRKDKQDYNDYNDYKAKIFPKSGILTVKWWQWILDIPSEISP